MSKQINVVERIIPTKGEIQEKAQESKPLSEWVKNIIYRHATDKLEEEQFRTKID